MIRGRVGKDRRAMCCSICVRGTGAGKHIYLKTILFAVWVRGIGMGTQFLLENGFGSVAKHSIHMPVDKAKVGPVPGMVPSQRAHKNIGHACGTQSTMSGHLRLLQPCTATPLHDTGAVDRCNTAHEIRTRHVYLGGKRYADEANGAPHKQWGNAPMHEATEVESAQRNCSTQSEHNRSVQQHA